jgi:hypothetical protein
MENASVSEIELFLDSKQFYYCVALSTMKMGHSLLLWSVAQLICSST